MHLEPSVARRAPHGASIRRPTFEADHWALIERALLLTIGQPTPHEVRSAVRAAYAAVAVLKQQGVVDPAAGVPS